MIIKELTAKQLLADNHNRFNTRLVQKEDFIISIFDYLRKKLEQKSINTLSSIAFQILYREDKVLENRIKKVYRKIMQEEKEEFIRYKDRLAKKG